MRKKLQILGVVLVTSLFLLASCKAPSHCPAYSKVSVKQTSKSI